MKGEIEDALPIERTQKRIVKGISVFLGESLWLLGDSETRRAADAEFYGGKRPRCRSAEEIAGRRWCYNCFDYARLFVSLSKMFGIPTATGFVITERTVPHDGPFFYRGKKMPHLMPLVHLDECMEHPAMWRPVEADRGLTIGGDFENPCNGERYSFGGAGPHIEEVYLLGAEGRYSDVPVDLSMAGNVRAAVERVMAAPSLTGESAKQTNLFNLKNLGQSNAQT